jgi:hypothetical protein
MRSAGEGTEPPNFEVGDPSVPPPPLELVLYRLQLERIHESLHA